MAKRRRKQGLGGTLVLDSQGVVKIAASNQRAQAFLTSARDRDARVVTSAITLTEVLRGGPRDTSVHRVLDKVAQLAVSPALGRKAGELIGNSGLRGVTFDAVVAATALDQTGPVIVLTSDPDHLTQLTESRKDVAVEGV